MQDSIKKEMKPLNVLVVGCGAVGGYYGGRLAQAGASVSVVCRSEYEIIQEKGVYIESVNGDYHFIPNQVLRDADTYQGDLDLLILTTKVLPQNNIKKLMGSNLNKKTAIMLLQNGINIEADVQAAYPDHEIISGLPFICVFRKGDGVVVHQDYGLVEIGCFPNGESDCTSRIKTLFSRVGVPCQTSVCIQKKRWEKLVWNAPFNPLSVISGGKDTQALLRDKYWVRIIRAVMREVCALSDADGFPLDAGIVDYKIAQTKKMAPYKTSMLWDIEAGRDIEIDAILGNAIQFGIQKGIETPEIEWLYKELKKIKNNSEEN